MTNKPSWRSMEFWGTVALHMVTLFVLSGAFPDTHWSMKVAAMVISGLGQMGFTASRTAVKTAEAKAGKPGIELLDFASGTISTTAPKAKK